MQPVINALRKLQISAYPDPSISPEITTFSHSYPWQLYTRMRGVMITANLQQTYPVEALRAELERVLAAYQPKNQFGQYHVGGWSGIALHAVNGDPAEDRDIPGGQFDKTPALALAPTMEAIMDAFPGEKRRVRILRLKPGRKIFWHRDFWHSVDSTQIRLHIPIVTNPKVGFQIGHEDCSWQPGELWYGDFTFPHRLQNGGTEDRVHLVLDLVTNESLKDMLPPELVAQKSLRDTARQRCGQLMDAWNYAFATERRLAERISTRPDD